MMLGIVLQFAIHLALLNTSRALECNDAKSCAYINVTNGTNDIECNGFASCLESPLIETVNSGVLVCRGSFSCFNASLVQHVYESNAATITCNGLYSCAMIKEYLHNQGGYTHCLGELSCYHTKIRTDIGGTLNELYCRGDRSCADSIIFGGFENIFDGHLAAQNAIIYSNGSFGNWFQGADSGNGALLVCNNATTCPVTCYGYVLLL